VTAHAHADPDEATLRFLVAEDRQFQRRLVTDMLRTLGRAEISYAGSAEECLSLAGVGATDILFVAWEFEAGAGLDLVKRLRGGEGGDNCRKAPIVMMAARRFQRDVEAARDAGVDEFIVRPFSITTVQRRIQSIQRKQAYAEGRTPKDDSPEVQIRKGLVRMYVERLNAMLAVLTPGGDARDFKLACAQLSVLANDLKEPLLISATFSLSNYVRAVGGDERMNGGVVEAHLQAILQLAELPNCQYEIRRTVTSELNTLVTKKLGRAA
jgi:DNA-binding response OmpR family regulator